MPQVVSSSEDEDIDIEKNASPRLPPHMADSKTTRDAPESEKETQIAKIDPQNPDSTGIAAKQEIEGAVNGTKKPIADSKQTVKGSSAVEAAPSQQAGKRRGRPPGSKNKIKKDKPATEAPKAIKQPHPLSLPQNEVAASAEPVTKRAKIQAEFQEGLLLPVALGTSNTAIATGSPKPGLIRPRHPEPQPISDLPNLGKEIPSTSPAAAEVMATAAAVASEAKTITNHLASTQPAFPSLNKNPHPPPSSTINLDSELPSKDNNLTMSKPSAQKLNQLDLAPGEALRTWLEENKTQVIEEKLIEELPEDVPLHQPSVEELASNAACAEFQVLLPGLLSNREAISQATAAALKVAATGASARAVRMVVDAASDAAGPQERLPYLYLLDSAVKLELRTAQELENEEKKEAGKKEQAGLQSSGFRRAVGAALQRLVHLLLDGDEQIRKKVEKLLGIWQREGLIAASLIEPVMQSLQLDAENRKKQAAAVQEDRLHALLMHNPMKMAMKITYMVPNGEQKVLTLPKRNKEPDDWTMPRDLGIEVPVAPGAVRKMKFLSSSSSQAPPPQPQSQPQSQMQSQGGDISMSPWCRDRQYETQYQDPYGGKNFINGNYQGQNQKPPPPPMPPVPPVPEPEEGEIELDEFDQGLLRDAYGIGGDAGGGGRGGGQGGLATLNARPPVLPPPVPSHSPINTDYYSEDFSAQWGGMPHGNATANTYIGNPGLAGGGEAPDVMQWQFMQQQAQAQEMMMRNQMAMNAGPMGMNNVVLPQQQMQLPHQGVVGGFGGGVAPAMAAMGMGMQLPSQEQQFAMMNASMMGGNDFGGDYGYGGAGMSMMQQQQGGGGGQFGGDARGHQRGHGRQGAGNNRQHRHQPYQQHHKQQHNRHDSNARR